MNMDFVAARNSFATAAGCITLKLDFMNWKIFTVVPLFCIIAFNADAWDYEGHHAVNELALASLPKNFPAFALTPTARDRIAVLAGEADRWRNETSVKNGTGLALGHASGPDHYIDLEDLRLYGLTPATLPPLARTTAAVSLSSGRPKP